MVTVEKKTFDNGVLRMVGVSKTDCILSVAMQTLSFVVPSLILSYSIAVVVNYYLLKMIYTPDMGLRVSIVPDWFATLQALALGLMIPLVSAIIPI